MYDNLNELIDINLRLLKEKEENSEFFLDFLNLEGEQFCQLGKFKEAERLAENMQFKGLIEINDELAILTELGYKISKNGGWKKHIQNQFDKDLNNKRIKGHKEKLELDNLKLQKENLEHQKSVRDRDGQIRNLTIDNLRLGNWDIRFRWYLAVITYAPHQLHIGS